MDSRKRGGGVPAELRRARDRLAAWRRTRRVGARIPEPLWTLAIELADDHGLHRTASVLGLDYYSLKKRAESPSGRGRRAAAAFVELSPSPSTPPPASPPASASACECLVEFENGLGGRLRVHLKGPDLKGLAAPDLVALAALVRSGGNAE